MGCLVSKNHSEVNNLLNIQNALNQERSELLFKISNEKISRHLSSKPLDLKLQNDSQITKEYLDTRMSDITESLNELKKIKTIEDPDFSDLFEKFDELIEHPFYDDTKSSVKSTHSRIKSLQMKSKELTYTKEDLERENSTIEELEQRLAGNEKEIKRLKIIAAGVKDKIADLRDYLESLKKRKRRFTVAALQPNKAQLRSKVLLKQEMQKKIEIIKTEQAKFLQKIEEKKEKSREAFESTDHGSPRNFLNPASFTDELALLQENKEFRRTRERSITSIPRVRL